MKEIIIFIIGQIIILASISITAFFAYKNYIKQKAIDYKIEKYREIVILISSFLSDDKYDNYQYKTEFIEKYKESWLFASDNFIKLLTNFIDQVNINSDNQKISKKEIEKLLADIVIEIRRDLNVKTKLKSTDILFVSVKK